MSEWTFKGWYEKNKDELNRKRRERYHSDPEYRKKVQAASRRSAAKKPSASHYPKSKDKKGELKLFGVSYVANQLGVSPATIHRWGRNGYFPKAKHAEAYNKFTQGEIDLLMKLKSFIDLYGRQFSKSKAARNKRAVVVSQIWKEWPYA